MTKITSSTLNLHVGIESISNQSQNVGGVTGTNKTHLPKAVQLAPSDAPKKYLEKSLISQSSSTLDIDLSNYLQPEISERNMLIPVTFSQNMQKAKETLQNLAEHDNNLVLREALNVLAEDTDLQETLQTYRSMLVQG